MGSWKEKVDAAYDMVHALCQPRGSEGSRQWIMSIPAREDYDPDLVITSGLNSAAKEIHALTAERDRLAAEISATNAAYATLLESHELILDALTESDATLDRLRAVGEDWIRGGESLEGSYEAMTRMYAILNPENET